MDKELHTQENSDASVAGESTSPEEPIEESAAETEETADEISEPASSAPENSETASPVSENSPDCEGIAFESSVEEPKMDDDVTFGRVERAGRYLLLICFVSLAVGTFIVAGSHRTEEDKKPAQTGQFSYLEMGSEEGVALVNVYGVISFSSEEASFPSFGSVDSGADGTVRLLRQLRTVDRVKAVVLRVNSPGGTVAASQEIYEEIKALKEAGKKVVVSMGDVAASGGYYISAPANYIFASPGTMTGSIGVIMSLMDYEPVLKKIGVGYRVFKSGKFKDMGAGYREMSEDEKQMLQEMVMGSWEQFVGAVAEGRILEEEIDGRKVVIKDREVLEKEICLGQIFLGTQALELGLVDELGGLNDAISKAGELAKLGKNPHVIRTTPGDGLQKFLSMFSAMAKPQLDPFKTLLKGGTLPPLLYLYVPGGR